MPIDPQGRVIHKLRVQLTDACNFRCLYCMPEKSAFLSARELLTPAELTRICKGLHALGVDELRITGGEPTLRSDFEAAMEALAEIPWSSMGLTTNGSLLAGKLDFLREIGCTSLNISLDSLNPHRFAELSRRDQFSATLSSIHAALDKGFRVKINMVVMRGKNDAEIKDFLEFSIRYGVAVRFLELMKVGPGAQRHAERFVAAAEILERLGEWDDVIPASAPPDSTARLFTTLRGGKIGIIASESLPFCGTCSRLRLTATGKLRSCLFSEAGLDVRHEDTLDFPEILHRVMGMKPTGRLPLIAQAMNQIGG